MLLVLCCVGSLRNPPPMCGQVLSPGASESGCWAEALHSFPWAAPTRPQAQLSETQAKSVLKIK